MAVLLAACANTGGSADTSVTSSSTTASVFPTSTDTTDLGHAPIEALTRSITVGGVGSEYAAPDRCILNLGITSRRPTVDEASRAAAASAGAMREALTTAGVEAQDIQTSEFSISPYYDEYPNLVGYETQLAYRVTMQDVDAVGTILASVITAGGDDVRAWAVRFETDPDGLVDVARTEAWEDAKGRAEALAALAGEPLGEVLDAHEKVLLTSPQGDMQGGEGDAAQFDIPVSPGVSGVIVLLTVTFAIGE